MGEIPQGDSMTTQDAYRNLYAWNERMSESNMFQFWHTYALIWHWFAEEFQ